jgi:hypothetical protein
MSDRNHHFSILSDYSQEDYEIAALAAFSDGPAAARLDPLVNYFLSLTDSFETLLSRPEVPNKLRVSLERLFHVQPTWSPPGFTPSTVGLATLISESEAADFEFGYRGTGQRERLIFNSEIGEIEVDITETPSGNRYVIRCQIDPDDPETTLLPGEAFLVPLARPDQVSRASFDEDGFFSFTTESGVYDLAMVCGSHAVRLPGIEVG